MSICKSCAAQTSDFFTVNGCRVYICIDCLHKDSQRLLDSGKYDDLRVAIKWPDGPAEITTGRQMRLRDRIGD
jgi:hypothetical protein